MFSFSLSFLSHVRELKNTLSASGKAISSSPYLADQGSEGMFRTAGHMDLETNTSTLGDKRPKATIWPKVLKKRMDYSWHQGLPLTQQSAHARCMLGGSALGCHVGGLVFITATAGVVGKSLGRWWQWQQLQKPGSCSGAQVAAIHPCCGSSGDLNPERGRSCYTSFCSPAAGRWCLLPPTCKKPSMSTLRGKHPLREGGPFLFCLTSSLAE
jgi:hypothetical protein